MKAMLAIKVVGSIEDPKFRALMEMVVEDFKGHHTINAFYPAATTKTELHKIADTNVSSAVVAEVIPPVERKTYVRDQRRFNGRFRHASGKSLNDFIFEFLAEKDVHEYRDLERRIMSIGFAKASLSTALAPFVNTGRVTRQNSKVYVIKEKK